MYKDQTLIIVVAIISILIMECIALLKGIDGALLMTSLAIVGGLAGYEVRTIKNHLEGVIPKKKES